MKSGCFDGKIITESDFMIRKTIEKDPFLYCQPEKLFVEELKKPVHSVKPAYFNAHPVLLLSACLH